MKRLLDVLFEKWPRTLFTIFIAALLVRVVFILTLQDGFYFPDSSFYLKAAINLVTNGELGQTYNRPPGYPVFLAGIYIVFGESIFAIRIVESLMGAFLAILIALIGRRIGGEIVGTLAGILWSLYPIGVFIAGLVYPTNLLTLLLACGIFGFLSCLHDEFSTGKIFFWGLLLGLAALTIPIVIATVGVMSLWIMCFVRARRLLLVSLFLFGLAIVVVPWMVRDYYVYDKLVIVEPRVEQHLPGIRDSQNTTPGGIIDAIFKHPARFAARFSGNFLRFWQLYPDRLAMDRPGFRDEMYEQDSRLVKNTVFTTNDLIIRAVSILSTGPLFFFAVIGTAAMGFRQERRRDLALLLAIILSFAIGYSIFAVQLRYRIPIEPYIIILSAYGIKKTWDVLLLKKFDVRSSKFEVEAEVKVREVRGSKFEV